MARLIAYECEDTDHGSCCTAHTAATANHRAAFTTWFLDYVCDVLSPNVHLLTITYTYKI